jgi:hypothetical protein
LSPVLIAKVQHGAPHPQTVLERFTNPGDESSEEDFDALDWSEDEEDETAKNAAKGARMGDVEWIAFEVFQDDESDEEDDEDSEDSEHIDTDFLQEISSLTLNPPESGPPSVPSGISLEHQHSSLSLLEYLLRMSALQTFEQQSHMNLTDEHIVLFLRDDNPSSRQQQSFEPEPERSVRRRSSAQSISSDFSARGNLRGLPLSPPRSDEMESPQGITPSSIHSTPVTKAPEKPAGKNARTNLERAMAANYDPMTLVTPPPANRRITRNGHRKPLKAPKGDAHGSNSAPGSLQRNYANTADGEKSGTNHSPLLAKVEVSRRAASSGNNAFRKAGK